MMKTINSENLEGFMKYTYVDKITTSEYASFLRYLVMTKKKELPIEIFNNADDTMIKGQVKDFSVDYQVDQEGENDNLTLNLVTVGDEEERTVSFGNIGKEKVSKDTQNSPRTFYRFYTYPESNEEGYRCTFNRRVTKK